MVYDSHVLGTQHDHYEYEHPDGDPAAYSEKLNAQTLANLLPILRWL